MVLLWQEFDQSSVYAIPLGRQKIEKRVLVIENRLGDSGCHHSLALGLFDGLVDLLRYASRRHRELLCGRMRVEGRIGEVKSEVVGFVKVISDEVGGGRLLKVRER